MVIKIDRRLFTVEEYHRMAEAGVLGEDDRVELIEGEVIKMAPIGSRHVSCVLRLNTFLNAQVAGRSLVNVQNPIRLGKFSEPQPDLALLKPRPDFYAQSHPTPEDILLVVEVAETSAEYDRQIKLPLYARAGIPEVWLVNLVEEKMEIYRQPFPSGYQTVKIAKSGESLTPLTLPQVQLPVEAILS